MAYSSKEFKESNINYINKDFQSIKGNLIEYAKSYFPTTYKDFNETSPGMMLLEMSAYVGDVLSFYIDQQYREMMLPLAEERTNVVNIARMMGYKVKPIIPAFAELVVKQVVGTNGNSTVPGPDYDSAVAIAEGLQAVSSTNTDLIFETLDAVDFTTSGSVTAVPEITSYDADGLATEFTLTRRVKAISGQTKQKTFSVGTPTKFLELKIPDNDVIEIIKVEDANGNEWHEVEYLAQDMVPLEKHYSSMGRSSAYTTIEDPSAETLELPVPYTLEFIRTSKRFTVEVNDDNTTSLIFGNGIMRSGQIQESSFLQSEQVGITVPGTPDKLITGIDPLLGDEYSTLGETPAHTSMVVAYRAGGGMQANAATGNITTLNAPTYLKGSGATLTVTNEMPARGGSNAESIEEIRQRARAFFTTQNRCVTKNDYEARVMNMASRFGNIAKVYVDRVNLATLEGEPVDVNVSEYFDLDGDGSVDHSDYQTLVKAIESTVSEVLALPYNRNLLSKYKSPELQTILNQLEPFFGSDSTPSVAVHADGTIATTAVVAAALGTIDVWTLSYNNNKNLVTTPADPIGVNIKNYLSQFRLLTDEVNIKSGYVINFGVLFDVYTHKHANKQDVKFKCIQKITDYFNIDKAQFRQPIQVNQLEYELMSVDGVRSVNYVCLTQGNDWKGSNEVIFSPQLWNYKWDEVTDDWTTSGGTTGYGHLYDFASSEVNGIVRPPITPSVFELKNPKQNVMGRVH